MELKQLLYFIELANTEHISQTADQLHMSQPALSKSLHSLEKELGIKLFDRQGKRIVLNEQGRVFLNYVKHGIGSIHQGINLAQRLKYEVTGKIRIRSLITTKKFEEQVYEYQQLNPYVQFEMKRYSKNENAADGDVDFIMCTNLEEFVPFYKANFWSTWEVCDGELGLAVPKGSIWDPGDHSEPVLLKDYANAPFIMAAQRTGATSPMDRLCMAAGFFPHIICEATDSNFRLGMIAHGLGVAIITKEHIKKVGAMYPNIRYLSLYDDGCRFKICLMHPRENMMTSAALDFLQFLKQDSE